MANRILILLFLVCSSFQTLGQTDYSEKELNQFVFVYMDQKNNKKSFPIADAYIEDLERYGITQSRFREIFSKMLLEEDVSFSEAEESFFNEQKEKSKAEKAKNQNYVNASCEILGLDINTYKKIETAYKTDIKFQRSLKPYFDKYFNRRK